MTGKEILNVKLGDWIKSDTVAEFFHDCMLELWKEGEAFSGKRPFGDSDWQAQLADDLVRGNAIKGTITITGTGDEEVDWLWEDVNRAIALALKEAYLTR